MYNFMSPKRDYNINFKLTELSPLFLLTNVDSISWIFRLLMCRSTNITDNIVKPSPIFPQLLIIILTDFFEYILYPFVKSKIEILSKLLGK